MFKTRFHRARPAQASVGGFTLIELLTVVAMFAILIAVVSPAFNDTTRSNRLDATAIEFQSALKLARSEAVKRGTLVAVDPVTAGDWTSGLRITVDGDRNPVTAPVAGDQLIRQYVSLKNVVATLGPTRWVFDNTGANITLAAATSARVPIDNRVQLNLDSTPRCVRVNKAGMVTVINGACS